jgi:hypothetical protein
MLWGRKRPRERTPVVWRQDAFPFFYSIWESARGSVFLARRADKTLATAGFFLFVCSVYHMRTDLSRGGEKMEKMG